MNQGMGLSDRNAVMTATSLHLRWTEMVQESWLAIHMFGEDFHFPGTTREFPVATSRFLPSEQNSAPSEWLRGTSSVPFCAAL